MKVFIKGKNKPIELNNADFLAQGGEGKIYVKNDTVYKVCEPGKMIPEGKFIELGALTEPHIVKPEQILVDSKNVDVGYSMKYLKDTYTLCQLFTKAFRLRNNLKPDTVLDLVRQMQKTINHVHSHDILIVDMNEFNFLVDDKFKDVYFIDVNSYQTPHYPAMAIMDSIRDRHNHKFNKLTDWFSFGIITFQLFIGIHPYKGKHPRYTDLDARMQNNVSVFDKDVGYPVAACQPFTVIPDAYLQWYKAIFDKGERVPPPSDLVAVVHVAVVPTVKVVGGKSLAIDKLREFPQNIMGYYYSSGREVFVTPKKIFVDKRDYDNTHEKVSIGFTKTNQPIAAWIENGCVLLHDVINDKEIGFVSAGSKIMDFDGRIYVQNGMNIIEIEFTEIKNKILASSHIVANVLEQSTRFFSGVIVQNLFDAYYVSIFPESKQCQQVALRELDGLRVIDAKYDNKFLMVVAVDKGQYNRFTFHFKDGWKTYEVSEKKNVTYTGLNFTVLDNGVCVHIDEDENVEIFNKLNNIKVVNDDAIGQRMLYHKGAILLFVDDNILYSVTMKKP